MALEFIQLTQSSDPFQSLLGAKSRLLVSSPMGKRRGAVVGTGGRGDSKAGCMTIWHTTALLRRPVVTILTDCRTRASAQRVQRTKSQGSNGRQGLYSILGFQEDRFPRSHFPEEEWFIELTVGKKTGQALLGSAFFLLEWSCQRGRFPTACLTALPHLTQDCWHGLGGSA